MRGLDRLTESERAAILLAASVQAFREQMSAPSYEQEMAHMLYGPGAGRPLNIIVEAPFEIHAIKGACPPVLYRSDPAHRRAARGLAPRPKGTFKQKARQQAKRRSR